MANVGKLAVTLTAKSAPFNKGLAKAQKSTKKFSRGLGGALKRIGPMVAGIAALAGVGTLGLLIKRQATAIDKTAKLASALEVSTEALTGFHLAADLTGTSSETFNKGLSKLVRNLGEAKAGFGSGAMNLKLLGLETKELIKLSPEQAFLKASDAISKMESPAQRTAAAYAAFGRSGQEMLNMLALGSKGMAAIRAENERLGGSFSKLDGRKVEGMNDAISKLKLSVMGTFKRITILIAPYVTRIATLLTNGFVWFRKTVIPIVTATTRWIIDKLISIVGFVTPYFSAFWGYMKAGFTFLAGIFTTIYKHIVSGLQWLSKQFGGFGNSFTSFKELIIKGLITAEFGFKNFNNIASLSLLTIGYHAVKLGNQIQHIFTQVVPTYLTWFGENWKNIFSNAANYVMAVFKNIGKNIIQFVASIPDLITGRVSWADVASGFSSITDGFENSLAPLPEIAKRQIGATEKILGSSVSSMSKNLGGKYSAFLEKRLAETLGDGKTATDWISNLFSGNFKDLNLNIKTPKSPIGIDNTPATAAAKNVATPAALERGSSAAYSAGVSALYRTQESAVKTTAKENKKQTGLLDKINEGISKLTDSSTVVTIGA